MFLFTSDLHLTDRPKDSYRWEIFPWLHRQAELRGLKSIFLLGDIADAKNHHSNEFINRLVDSLRGLADVCEIYLLSGNHDSTNPEYPLLKFLNKEPLRQYIVPESIMVNGYKVLMVPNQKTQTSFTKILNSMKANNHEFVLMHQTFRGSVSSNGSKLDGFDPSILKTKQTVYISGDIHVPQKIGEVTYCGSPHPVHFGDTFKPRVLVWDGKELKSVSRVTVRKEVLEIHSLDSLKKADYLTVGDQVKVIYRLPRQRFGEWEQIRSDIETIATNNKWTLSGLELKDTETENKVQGTAPAASRSPAQIFDSFCRHNKIDKELTDFGRSLILSDPVS